ncbi:hypothetical protein [Streptomyces sp. NPDC047315]|uniref:hypothetical protein n=1 Tax=Streptomyces sp. NPDC047315 TaxID=3155142 RepID=UPI0033D7CB3A
MDAPDDGAHHTIRVDRRHNGPPHSANGGYACGLVATRASRHLNADGDLAVQLHAPPPLGTGLRLTRAGRRFHLWHGGELVATATPRASVTDTVGSVPPAVAEHAMRDYAGHRHHPFPTCFVCGPDHRDGLRLTPGPVPGPENRVACVWTPSAATCDGTGTVAEELVWAALDCPGGWALGPMRDPLLLARMAARVRILPRVGETVVVVGRGVPGIGRLRSCATALFRRDGTELARATATWVRPTAPAATSHDTKAGSS